MHMRFTQKNLLYDMEIDNTSPTNVEFNNTPSPASNYGAEANQALAVPPSTEDNETSLQTPIQSTATSNTNDEQSLDPVISDQKGPDQDVERVNT